MTRRSLLAGAGTLAGTVAGALAILAALPAAARTPHTVPYALGDVWPATVRYLRVDRGFPVKEKDESGGYILFDFQDAGKSYRASIELVRTTDTDGRDATQIVANIGDLPRHYEARLLDLLARKIRDERGTPPPPPPRKAPAPEKKETPDAGENMPRAPSTGELPRYGP